MTKLAALDRNEEKDVGVTANGDNSIPRGDEARIGEVCPAEVRSCEVRIAEVRPAEVRHGRQKNQTAHILAWPVRFCGGFLGSQADRVCTRSSWVLTKSA